MDTILEMRNITKTFPGVKALNNVNLNVRKGEIHALVGENGAGKSTLMKVLSGVYPHGSYEGEIHYKGEEQHFRDIADSERKGIIIIHQELALVPCCRLRRTFSSATNRRNSASSTGMSQNRVPANSLPRSGSRKIR